MKSVQLEDSTWETLSILKVKGKYQSFDALIKELLSPFKEA